MKNSYKTTLKMTGITVLLGMILAFGSATPAFAVQVNTPNQQPSQAELLAQIQSLLDLIAQLTILVEAQNNLDAVILPKSQDENTSSTLPELTDNNETVARYRNDFSCDREDNYGIGRVACYGMIDYDNDFGGHSYPCSGYGRGNCQTKIPACRSGVGAVYRHYARADLASASERTIRDIAENMNISPSVARNNIDGLWMYECTQYDKEQLIREENRETASVTSLNAKRGNREGEGQFVIKFAVTAGETDLLMKNNPYVYSAHHIPEAVERNKFNPMVIIVKDGEKTSGFGDRILSHMIPLITSSAPKANPIVGERDDNYFVIKAKQTEEIEISITMGVKEAGDYSLRLENSLLFKTQNGEEVDIPVQGTLETEPLYLTP